MLLPWRKHTYYKQNTQIVLVVIEEVFVEINVQKTKKIFRSRHQNAVVYYDAEIGIKYFKIATNFRCS